MLGLHFCARAFSSCGKRRPLLIAVRGPLTIAASLAAEHRLQTRRLSSCGSRAQLLRAMWDPPRPGPEPVSPALAGRLSTTAPPGKPTVGVYSYTFFFKHCLAAAHKFCYVVFWSLFTLFFDFLCDYFFDPWVIWKCLISKYLFSLISLFIDIQFNSVVVTEHTLISVLLNVLWLCFIA